MPEPTDEERRLNRQRAENARQALLEGARERAVSWPTSTTFDRVIIGGGLAATLDWATLGASRGTCCALADGSDPWWMRGQWRMGQPARELVSEGFVLQPHDFELDHGGFAPASGVSRAIALTAHEHDFPVVFEQSVQLPIEDEGPELEVRTDRLRVRASRVDVAVGPGPPRRLRDKKGEATIVSEDDEATLLARGRMIFGQDQWKRPVLGPRVMVYGGGATAAWNVEFARRSGATVAWYARDPRPRGGPIPGHFEGKVKQIEERLAYRSRPPDEARQRWLLRTRDRLLAFQLADLPRNRASFHDPEVTWAMAELLSVRPEGDRVKVVSASESGERVDVVDQLVVSIGQDSWAPTASAALIGRRSVTWLEHDGRETRPGDRNHAPRGRVVGVCEDRPDPRIRCLGAALLGGRWRKKLIRGVTGGVIYDLEAQLHQQADAAPTHSKGIEGAIFQVAANVLLANGGRLDELLDPERFRLLSETFSGP